MRFMVSVLATLLFAGPALAQTLPDVRPCQEADTLNLFDPKHPEEPFTTPPYVVLQASGELQRLARRSRPLRREIELKPDQVACLESLTGARLTAVRAGAIYRYKLQAPTGTLLLFHVRDLAGSEAIVPSPAERLMDNARRFLEDGNREEAARAYEEVLMAGPRPVEAAVALTALGRMVKEEGRPSDALANFREALNAYPRFVPALEEEATLAESLGFHEEARRANEALIELVPSRPGPYVALVRLANARGDREEMIRLFRQLQAVSPGAAVRLAHEIPALQGIESERKQAPPVKDVLEIPLKTRPGGALLVDVSVNGLAPMTFIVDTGASLVSLKEETAKGLGIRVDPERLGMLRTAKGFLPAHLIIIDQMEIRGIEAKNIEGVVLNQDFGEGVEGLLGQSFLNKINARIDVKKRVMVVE